MDYPELSMATLDSTPQDEGDYNDASASIFAHPKDIEEYNKAIARGLTEKQALKVGDNGIGAWGDDTTNPNDPIVALPTDTPGFARNRLVEVQGPKGKIVARVADKMPASANLEGDANIDLNPAAAKAVGHSGGVDPVKWRYADSPNTQLPPLSMASINQGQQSQNGNIPGISSVTAIGSGEGTQEIPGASVDDGSGVAYDPEQSQQPETGLPMPSSAGKANPTGLNPDGSVHFDNGMDVYKDGHIVWDMGGKKLLKTSPYSKFQSIPSANQLVDLTDSKTGQPYKAIVNKNTGEIVKKLDDPGSRPGAQAEMLRMRMINSAKSQPAIAAYVNIKNNYDSLSQNAAIPEDQRTPADDAAAIQAFGAIEHPGTGVTDADKKQAEELVPKITKLKMEMGNWLKNNARVLDSNTVNQMQAAAKRALDGRQKTYNDEVQPLLDEAKRVGLAPGQVNGALGANIMPAEAAPKTQSPVSQDKFTKGQTYRDAQGKSATYLGDGHWQPQ
jgi:hypothetical protein